MPIFAGIAGVALLVIVLWDTLETVILPRSVLSRVRLTILLNRVSWRLWRVVAGRCGPRRERILGMYGPLFLVLLLEAWAAGLVLGFALLHWAIGSHITAAAGAARFPMDIYFSGTTFFTLGLGDLSPHTGMGRALTVLEANMGLGFLAIVIGYFPVLYAGFSRREATISLMDARAGSPPSAGELLTRYARAGQVGALPALLRDFEQWSAELLESHLSYPMLAFYRSQHDRESWLSALTMVLDASAIVVAGVGDVPEWQGRLTFAMARHAAVDLALIFNTPPIEPPANRLPPKEYDRLSSALTNAGLTPRNGDAAAVLADLRALYEPYVYALARYLVLSMPPWLPAHLEADNWQTTAWKITRHF